MIITVTTTAVPTDGMRGTGIYYDENGRPMLGSVLVRDTAFQDRVVAETRALLATVPVVGDHTVADAPGISPR